MSALIHALNALLLDSPTATAALARWCEQRGLGHGPVFAHRLADGPAPTPETTVLQALQPQPGEPIVHRRVRLYRGAVCLSEAENWYLPSRLHPEMRRTLEQTEIPFGAVIEPLRPSRRTQSVTFADPSTPAPDCILEHRALVLAEPGHPIALVRERYRPELLARPATPPAPAAPPPPRAPGRS